MPNKDRALHRVLIFRDAGKPGMGVAAALRKTSRKGPPLSLVSATIDTLRPLLERQPVSAVIIDVGREIGATMAALRILKGFPAVPLFIFNGFLLPRIVEKAREYAQARYVERHDELNESLALILAASDRANRASGHSLSLRQFKQLLNLEKWSGRIKVTAGTDQGLLLFRDGGLIDAATGATSGRSAWERMAAWKDISVETFADGPSTTSSGVAWPPPIPDPGRAVAGPATGSGNGGGSGNIESLHLVRRGRKLVLNLKKLNLGVGDIRDALSTQLLMTDIFLSSNSLPLAGWNSNPLACSQFAAITRSLIVSLQGSGFPDLGAYYLLDLDDDQLLFIVVRDELQWGFRLRGLKERMGLLLNVVLPKAMKALDEALAVEPGA
jgi:hypothetical protein